MAKKVILDKRKYAVDYIFDLVDSALDSGKIRIRVGGDTIKITQTILTFFFKGIKCKRCGIKGKFFVKDYKGDSKSYYLNLYAVDNEGNLLLMTKDHIIPKSKKGKNLLRNYPTMCSECNCEKADKLY